MFGECQWIVISYSDYFLYSPHNSSDTQPHFFLFPFVALF